MENVESLPPLEDPMFWISSGIIFCLLCLSGFFSGSETSLTAVSEARMLSMEKDGNKRATLVRKLTERKERLIGALLLGNNLVNILATSLATGVLMAIFGEAGIVYATLFMTLLVLIFAEVLPKTYALMNADRMALFISPIINVVVIVFSPISECVVWIVRNTLRLFGVQVDIVNVGGNEEELRGAIEMHRGPKQEVQDQRAMLRSILDLVNVEVEDIMVHRKNVEVLDIDMPIPELVHEVLHSRYTRIPLYQGNQDEIVGVLHAKELFRALQRADNDVDKITIGEIVSSPWFIPETTNLYDQLQAFRERREHFALVVDEYGVFKGVVTLEDILEEIVGEIDDEHDITVKGVRKGPNGLFLIKGDVTIRDLNREFEWDLPDEEYATLAGLIIFESKQLPDVNQRFSFYGFDFEIIRRQRNQITLIAVRPPTVEDE
ncbi:MAG: HlyC/CorC family transporter [Pseudomonadota bacterium]|nr:HlyC/CorC family transporter [Pseudomonadota bacterium]